jgi:hypothetical protein
MIGMKLPGNAVVPCRFCHLIGRTAPTGHYYYPHTDHYLRGRLPLRINLREEIIDVCKTNNKEIRNLHGMTLFL